MSRELFAKWGKMSYVLNKTIHFSQFCSIINCFYKVFVAS